MKLTALLAFGLVCLTLALSLTGYVLGLVPDAFKTELDARAKVAEALAVQLANGINAGETELTGATLDAVVERNGDVHSVAVRGVDGAILLSRGDHDLHWQAPADGRSTATHVIVPLLGASGPQGAIEIAFGPASHGARVFGIPVSLLLFMGWLAATGFLGYAFLLRRSLKQLDPGRVIPQRVQKAFDTLGEGVVILDERERILLANTAFANLVGDRAAVAPGARMNKLGWRTGSDADGTAAPDAGGASAWPWHTAMKTQDDRRDVPLLLRVPQGAVLELRVNAARIAGDDDRTMGAIVTVAEAAQDTATRDALAAARRQLAAARLEAQEKGNALAHLRDHDPLTGCLHRRAFLQAPDTTAAGACEMALIRVGRPGALARAHGTALANDASVAAGLSLSGNATGDERVGRLRSDAFALSGPDLAHRAPVLAGLAARALDDLRPGLGALVRVAHAPLGELAPEDHLEALARMLDEADDEQHEAPAIEKTPIGDAAASRAAVPFAAAREMVANRLGGSRSGVLAHVSIDGWSELRDSLGDEGARDLIDAVAGRLRAIRTGGTATAILMGEGACLVGADDAAALAADEEDVARSALAALGEPFSVAGRDFHLSAHVGTTRVERDDDDVALAMRHARLAMRSADEEDRTDNWRSFEPEMAVLATRSLDIEAGIRAALRAEAFGLVFQPITDIRTGELRAAETLLRCRAPELEGVRIDQIIAVAERSSLIAGIDRWVMNAALDQMKAWCDEGLGLPKLSVNLSARQCTDIAYMDGVVERLGTAGFDLAKLQIEVTESSALSDIAVAAPQLKRLQKMGVHIAIDDFGTGQASLAYMQRLHPDVVKIDRSFVTDLHTDHANATLVTATTAMSQALGLRVVAEGVETAEELEFLREIGCDEVQGYLIAKPMPADVMAQWTRLFVAGTRRAEAEADPVDDAIRAA